MSPWGLKKQEGVFQSPCPSLTFVVIPLCNMTIISHNLQVLLYFIYLHTVYPHVFNYLQNFLQKTKEQYACLIRLKTKVAIRTPITNRTKENYSHGIVLLMEHSTLLKLKAKNITEHYRYHLCSCLHMSAIRILFYLQILTYLSPQSNPLPNPDSNCSYKQLPPLV